MGIIENIDWALTKEKFHISLDIPHLSNKIVVYKCPRCQKLSYIQYKEVKRRKYAECLKCIAKLDVYKANISKSAKKALQDPVVLSKIRDKSIINWPNIRDKMRIGLDIKWQDKRFIEKKRQECLIRNKKLWLNRSELINKLKLTFDNKRLSEMSEISRRLWTLRSYRDRTIASIRTPENLELISRLSKARWDNQEYRTKMSKMVLNMPRTSSQQHILYSLLDDLKIKYYKDSDEKCRIGYYCFDCRIDPQEGVILKKPLLIEVQGDYWHSLPKSIQRDKSKATYLRTYFPEFDLKYLWEHEFDNKDRIIGLLKYWLGLSIQSLIQFDFKDIREEIINYKEAELFISKYHYAGRVWRGGINLGYYLGDKLVAVVLYSNLIRQEVALKQGFVYKEMLELSRFAIHPEYQVKNLASYIISKSINYIRINKLDIKCLISFADSTYNHLGIIYKASNWELDGEVKPDYWYCDSRGYICHKKTLWDKAKKMCITENEYAIKFGYAKIWGDKKYRYIFKFV